MPTRTGTRKAAPETPKGAAETQRIMARLFAQHPNADTELHYTTPYELLVATILSAQCTDERVNQVTPALFTRYPDARALSRATTAELEPQIQSTGFFRAKSRSLVGMATAVMDQHRGEVPNTMEQLVKLPGVGRKTANVVLGHALGVPGLPVDRHVLRVANRIGIVNSPEPEVVEQQLCAAMPPAQWTLTSDTLILHGRRICKPRPLCEKCAVRSDCDYYRSVMGVVATKEPPGLTASAKGYGGPPELQRRRKTRRHKESESTRLLKSRRAPEARTRASRSAETARPESTQLPKHRRGPKARGTGRGGGAPRQTKK